jgi:uncharacterized OB-fold protein
VRTPRKRLPIVDHQSQPYWEGCARGELLLQKCSDCGAHRHPPSPRCAECRSPNAEWVPASGEGTIYTFVVVRRSFDPAWEDDIPYVVAIVELAEGPHIMTNIVERRVDSVHVGMPVTVMFDHVTDEIALPKFIPVTPPIPAVDETERLEKQ